MIYAGVAVLSVSLLVLFNFVGKQNKAAAAESDIENRQNREALIELVVAPLTVLNHQISKDLKGVNQDGETVSLFDLK